MSAGSIWAASQQGSAMDDLIYLAAGAGLFLLMAGYLAALRRS